MTTGLCHEALFYDSDVTFRDALLPFVHDGLADGDAVIIAAHADNAALLRDALGEDAGRIVFIDRDQWYRRPVVTIAGWAAQLAGARARGHARVRIIGEVAFGSLDRHQAWTRYESAVNVLFADAPAWIVCPYDTRALPAAVLADALRTHPVIRDPVRRDSPGYLQPASLLAELLETPPAVTGPPLLDRVLHDVTDLSAVRQALRAIAAGWPSEPLDDLQLCVTEIAVNGLRHGRGERRLRVWREGSSVVCEVADDGPGPTDPLAGYAAPAGNGLGGRGLWIVRQLCDAVAIDGGRIRISLSAG
ncbi:sensor histidine kinase [Catenuloplanes japonicus]|uniref:sensor histidine kinase n=1 Tax=Catenuloplanes japonicus TaxID=33876 RepID=UPI0006906DD1|nr:sensor histidine kinase [Catenuloplanes japonicus]